MDLIEKARKILGIEAEQLGKLAARLDDTFTEVVHALAEALNQGRKIVVIGVGKSENIGNKFVATLNSTGATAVSLSCQNALHGDLGLISMGDLVIALSYSGETSEMISLLPHAKKTSLPSCRHHREPIVHPRKTQRSRSRHTRRRRSLSTPTRSYFEFDEHARPV